MPKRMGRDGNSNRELDMNSYFDDIAAALMILTYGVASVCAALVAIAGAI
jgi:hypothetical protein